MSEQPNIVTEEFSDWAGNQMDDYDRQKLNRMKAQEIKNELDDPRVVAYSNAIKTLCDKASCNNYTSIDEFFDKLGLELGEPIPHNGRIMILLQALLLTKPDDKAYRQSVRWFLSAKNGGI